MTRITLVMGGGGVGKTTIAAGLGALAARGGLRTLVITVDPARRLAAALGVALGSRPAPVPGAPGLDAAMLDAAEAWRAIARTHADAPTAERLLANPFYAAIADRFPSGQSYAAGEEVAAHAADYDAVVVDTPPGDGGISFLRAPERVRRLVAGRALRLLTGPRLPGRRLVYSVTARPALKVADGVLGGRLLEDVAEFLLDLSTIYGPVTRRSREVESLLDAAEIVAVTTADPAPIAEVRRLVDHGRQPGVVVFNRMLPAAWAAPAPRGDDPLAANLTRWGAEAGRQRMLLDGFAARWGSPPLTVPWLPEPPADPAGLADLVAAAGIEVAPLS